MIKLPTFAVKENNLAKPEKMRIKPVK